MICHGSWFLLLLLLLLQVDDNHSKVVQGSLRTGENWAFLSRFCFLSVHGKFRYEVQFEERFGAQNIDLYYDTPAQWARVYGRKSNLKSCDEKESVLQVENNQFINLTTEMLVSGCTRLSPNVSGVVPQIRCEGTRNFNTARERWWFVAISNCNSSKGMQLNYRFVMSNGASGDLLHYHFSADEFYILPILIVSFLQHMTLLFLCIWSAIVLKMRQLLHATYKLFFVAVFLQTLGVFFLGLHYLIYAFDGLGLERARTNGRILEACSEIAFLLLLILVAKGYTVTRARLRQASAIKVTIFICCYCITYGTLFVFEKKFFDPGEVLYMYESLAGYGLVVLRSCGWLMFIYSTFFTLKHYPEKGGFYYPFFAFYTVWFISGPTIIVVSNHVIAEWVREKVVVSVEHFITFIGHVVFLVLTRPNAHNRNFPYHVRTTQIGILEALDSNGSNAHQNGNSSNNNNNNNNDVALGANTLDAFSHGGAYEVSSSTMDIFTVDTVGIAARSHFAAAPTPAPVPPPYSSNRPASAAASPPPPWAENSQRKNSASAAVNGIGGRRKSNNETGEGVTKIYDPNEDDGGNDE